MSTKNVMGFLQTKNMERFVGLFLSQLNCMVIMFSLMALNCNLTPTSMVKIAGRSSAILIHCMFFLCAFSHNQITIFL